MSKKVIKMNESVLRSLIKESISRVISEMDEGKYSNNKPFFHGGIRDVKPGEKAFKHTNPGADEKALEKHNARVDKHLPDMMDSDKLKAREAQIKSSERGGMPRENFKDTLEGELKKNKQEYKQVSESDLHRIIKESVSRVLNEVSTDTLHNAYQKSRNLTMGMPNLSDDPKIRRKFRQKHAFADELDKRHSNEISAIDPDTTQGYGADFYEHPELRNTKAYKMAYDYVSDFDWFVNGDIDLDAWSLHDLALDVESDTRIPSSIAEQAIVDYLRNEFGYKVY